MRFKAKEIGILTPILDKAAILHVLQKAYTPKFPFKHPERRPGAEASS